MRDTAQDEINFELKIGYRASSEMGILRRDSTMQLKLCDCKGFIKAGGQRGKTGGIVALRNVIIKDKRRQGGARRE